MADKPVTIRRERIGKKIGRLGNQDMARLGIAWALSWASLISGKARRFVSSSKNQHGCFFDPLS
jgi:hypothetical protein